MHRACNWKQKRGIDTAQTLAIARLSRDAARFAAQVSRNHHLHRPLRLRRESKALHAPHGKQAHSAVFSHNPLTGREIKYIKRYF
jgi:hypothetical protein